MTTQEFKKLLDTANTVLEIQAIRATTGSPLFINMCKEKTFEAYKKEGWGLMSELDGRNIKKVTGGHCNSNGVYTVEMPSKSRVFPDKFLGKKAVLHVVENRADKFSSKATLLIKLA